MPAWIQTCIFTVENYVEVVIVRYNPMRKNSLFVFGLYKHSHFLVSDLLVPAILCAETPTKSIVQVYLCYLEKTVNVLKISYEFPKIFAAT